MITQTQVCLPWDSGLHPAPLLASGDFSVYSSEGSVQSSSVAQSCPTLCHPRDCGMPGFPVHHQLLELAQTHVHRVSDATQPSHPLSSPSPPAFSQVQRDAWVINQLMKYICFLRLSLVWSGIMSSWLPFHPYSLVPCTPHMWLTLCKYLFNELRASDTNGLETHFSRLEGTFDLRFISFDMQPSLGTVPSPKWE